MPGCNREKNWWGGKTFCRAPGLAKLFKGGFTHFVNVSHFRP